MGTGEKTFEELAADEVGTRYVDREVEGVRILVLRGPFSLCAYIGIPLDSPLARIPYDDIPIRVHGGLTYGDTGDDKMRPAGCFWFGWDHNHAGDYPFYGRQNFWRSLMEREGDHRWLIDEVEEEAERAAYDMSRLLALLTDLGVK